MNFLRKVVGRRKVSDNVFKNMLVLAIGTSAGKAVALLAIPILARIYTPEDFGLLSTYTSLVTLIAPLGTFLYVVAIPLPYNDRLAAQIVVLCIGICFIFSIALSILFFFQGEIILGWFNLNVLAPYWLLLVAGVVVISLYEIFSYWATREKKFNLLAKTQVTQNFIGSIVKITLGLFFIKSIGLIIGQISQQGGGVIKFYLEFKEKIFSLVVKEKKYKLFFLLKRYSNLPKFKLPAQLLYVFSAQAPLLFSTAFFGVHVTGQLGLAMTAVALPINILAQTTSKAYFAEISRIGKKKRNEIYQITLSVTKKMFLLGLGPSLILLFLGPYIFQIVFGEQWKQAGIFASCLSIYLLTQFLASPIMTALNVLEKQGLALKIHFMRAIYVIAIFSIGHYLGANSISIILVYSIIISIHYMVVSKIIFSIIKEK